jgi:hypothetical protein
MRLLIAVKSCQKDKQAGYHQAIRETWGKTLPKGVDLLFFVGGTTPPPNLEKDERYLPVSDGYWESWPKAHAILRYAIQKSYDFSLLCDTDTYIVLPELMRSGFESYDYCGAWINPPGAVFGKVYPPFYTGYYHFLVSPSYAWASGGHGYILSKTAAKIAAAALPLCGEGEDFFVGCTLGPFIMSGEIKAKIIPNLLNVTFHLACGFYGGGLGHQGQTMHAFKRSNAADALWKKHKELTGLIRPAVNAPPKNEEESRTKTALVVIASGEIYWRYAEALIVSAKKFFIPHDIFLFTDREAKFDVKKQVAIPSLRFPEATLKRYHIFLEEEEALSQYENIFYCDADMLFAESIAENEILSYGITVVEHPGFLGHPEGASYESNPASTAYLKQAMTYVCGGFNGGTSRAYLEMAKVIRAAIDTDLEHGIVARWHDESHLNRYCYDNPPARILSPAFCHPIPGEAYRKGWEAARGAEYVKTIVPKIIAIEKTMEERIARAR